VRAALGRRAGHGYRRAGRVTGRGPVDSLTMIVPSRGRPWNILALVEAWERTASPALRSPYIVQPPTELLVGLDDDDPELDVYRDILTTRFPGLPWVRWDVHSRQGFVGTLNRLALAEVERGVGMVGFLGDDHRPRSRGWDLALRSELLRLGTGLAYGDDLVQGRRLPTAVVMTADIVHTLGYMALPTLRHLYVDNFWRDLGRRLGRITFLPEVVIEHCHPVAGTAPMDDRYAEVNAPEMYAHDRAAYELYLQDGLAADLDRLEILSRHETRWF
jgi:hypothetical protein